MTRLLVLALAISVFAATPQAFATLADAAHRPFNADVPAANGTANPRHQFREPYVEISNNPANPTTITVYTVMKKFNNPFGTANQTGGTLFYKGASQGVWQSVSLGFHANEGDFQYWKASFSSSSFAANEVIQYYFQLLFDQGAENTYIYAGSGFGDLNSQTTNQQSVAAGNAFTIRNRAAWIFHANNRVTSGSDVQFWAKVGYVGDPTNNATRWVTNGALYYTLDGSAPTGSLGIPSGNTVSVPFTYDHPETQTQGSPSPAGIAMWWKASAQGLLAAAPYGGTIRYRISFWNPANNEEKFAEHNAGTNDTTFTFTNGTIGDPSLTVNGVSANYTTTHVFVDETKGDSVPFTIVFSPGQPNVTAAEVFTNLDRRDKATTPHTVNGISTEEGIVPFDGNSLVAGDDSHYFKTYTMTPTGNAGQYSLGLNATKTGAYRLTARWKVQGDSNWRYYTNIGAGRRDHAIVVSPVTARNINLYEANVLNLDASGASFAQRGTLEDMYDAPNAPHQGADNHWNLNYLKNLGCNWLWFQPVHPITQEAQQGHDPGSPYSVRNFFDINPLMSANYNAAAGVNDPGNRDAARQAFQGLVAAANTAGVGVMLDAPFNHTAPDSEISTQGTALFGNNPGDLLRDKEARFYSRDVNYAMRASSAANIAIAPDRGDFGKWGDVRDVYFGRYAALVDMNPNGNGNYLNEQDWFDYSIGDENSSGSGNGHFDQVTQNVWRFFSNYTLYWLSQTGVPAGTDLATQTAKGISGLRADFGQGLPPQFWEYAINKTRTRKWNFVFMAESLDGGAVTYRSNRHFDILNENIVFPLKSASGASDYRNIFEGRRGAYGQSLVLMNNMSHDEEAFQDPWQAVVRYAVCSSVDGVPLIFPGQELGISTTFGYSSYEVNFGKNIANFKDFNSMAPAWNDNVYGNDQLYPVYAAIGQARLSSVALRSPNRFFLNEDGNNQTIYGVAKYQTLNGLPGNSDVVFAFANTNRDASPSGNFHLNQDVDGNGQNDYGIQPGRTYNIRNIAAYTNIDPNRRTYFLWNGGRTGADILNNGVFVAMNRVPQDNGSWATAPYEAQYLKLYDVTAPSSPPGTPATANGFNYSLGNGSVLISWNAAPPDAGGVQPVYRVTYNVNGGPPQTFVTSSTSFNLSGNIGQTITVTITAINPNDNSVAGPSSTATVRFLDPNADDDGDGMNNAAEDAAGTNPLDPTSVFRVANIARSSNNVSVTWSSVPGKQYQLESASSVFGTYTAVGPVVTANSSTTSETVSATSKTFYHVRLVSGTPTADAALRDAWSGWR
ncbi:MAG: hypothetical protein M3032_06925 [Verrucomicrobiota bacterium]|nr:hypothetical protein [Verrucomicrobiota bacterium]